MQDRIPALIHEIEVAFEKVPYPGDNDLIVLFGGGEGIEFVDLFKGKHWRDIPLEKLVNDTYLATSLGHMTPHAFHFYLPGFLIATLKYYDSEISRSTLFNLTPPDANDAVRWPLYIDTMSQLSPDERNAIIVFLQYIRPLYLDDQIDRAIDYISGIGR